MSGSIIQILGLSGVGRRSVIVGDRSAIMQLRSACAEALAEGVAESIITTEDGIKKVTVVVIDTGSERTEEGIGNEGPSKDAIDKKSSLGRSHAIPKQNLPRRRTASGTMMLRLPEVVAICGLSKTSVYRAIKRKDFPAPIKLSAKSSAWLESEIYDWVQAHIKARREK